MTILRWYGIELEKEIYCPTCGDFEKGLKDTYNIKSDVADLPGLPEGKL